MAVIGPEARFVRLIDSLPMDFVRMQYIKKVRFAKARTSEGVAQFASEGFEEVAAPQDALVLDDGRPVIWAFGRAWALRMEQHRAAVQEAMEAERKNREAATTGETSSVAGTESLSLMTCPKCGDALQHSAVCPKCAAGQLGYRHRYVCVCGGVDMVSKEAL